MKRIDFHWIVDTWTYANKKRVPLFIEYNAEFYFIEKTEEIKNRENAYFVIITNDNFSEEDLLNEYYIKLKFPPYFGFNWDAFNDCLRYLENIEQKNVIIYHPQLPQLNEKDLKIYLKILRDAVRLWKKYEEHNFEVYFNLKDYDQVKQIIG